MAAAILLIAVPARADFWYEHYSRAEEALEREDWTLAVQEINEALERKGDSGARVRSYGMKVTPYFPYFKLGIAYYHLGQLDAALQAFETEVRLGAIAQSEAASAELSNYQRLVREAQVTAAVSEQERIRQIVEQSLDTARELESRGLLDEAMAALDQALAVAPGAADAEEAMSRLRTRFAERQESEERDQRFSTLVENGRSLLNEHQYSEASSLFREALFLKPSVEVQELLDDTQGMLLAEIEGSREFEDWRTATASWLEEARDLESTGQLTAALERLQFALVLEPSSQEALSLQARLLSARNDASAERTRQALIAELLAETESRFEIGAADQALSAANRVLALDPSNDAALRHVARAYGVISGQLLGTVAGGNIPPAVRFLDLRQESDDGALIQTTSTPDFRLSGVIIDNSPVSVAFFDDNNEALKADLSSQPLGEFFVTEFNVQSTLAKGHSTFRLVATDTENLSSSSEYMVIYARPFFRAPWFYALLVSCCIALGGTALLLRRRQRDQLRRRKFNPYIAGAPVREDEMFFGRSALVNRILQTVHNNSLLVYGERRIGKTSIQHQLKKRLSELDDPVYDFHSVYIDLQGTVEAYFFQTIAEEIFQELAPVLDGLRPAKTIDMNYSYRDFVGDIRAVLKTLKRRTSRKVRLVLLIDEVDELNDYDPRVNQKLRSLFMKSFAEDLVAVVSGVEIKRTWEKEGSPWYNFFEEIEVEPLTPSEARALIEHPMANMFKMDGGVVERIISLTAGKPYLIQRICIALVSRLHERDRRRISIADVEAVARTIDA